jgi:pimeloyl-ACP methyl ester carboxylesterase
MSPEVTLFPTAKIQAEYEKAYEVGLSAWPRPFKGLNLDTKYGKTYVIVSGPESGPPIMLLHPAGIGSVIWCRNVTALSRRHRTFAVDVVGEINRSRVLHPPQTQDDLLSWLEEVLAVLNLRKASIVGNSYGGYLGALAAVYLPSRVDHLVLIAPAATLVGMPQLMLRFFPGYFTGSNRLKKWAMDWTWQGFPADDFIAELRAIASACSMPRHPPPKVLSDQALRALHSPTLLLIGDHEVVYKPTKAIGRATRLIPHVEAKIVPDANHNAQYTAADFVNAQVLAFLAEGAPLAA